MVYSNKEINNSDVSSEAVQIQFLFSRKSEITVRKHNQNIRKKMSMPINLLNLPVVLNFGEVVVARVAEIA